MITVKTVYDVLFAKFPEQTKCDWDNVGLLCGRFDAPVSKVMVALDPMPDVLEEAKIEGCELIVSHHPVFITPILRLNDTALETKSLLFLIENHMNSINLHTNLDCARGGVNDTLAAKLGLQNPEILNPVGTDCNGNPYGLLRFGEVPMQPLTEFAAFVKKTLGCKAVRFADGGKPVHKVAVGGGSCGSELSEVIAAGCDTFVTADLKYNHFEEAKYRGVNLIDAGHFQTENPACAVLAETIRAALPTLPVLLAKNHKDEMQIL